MYEWLGICLALLALLTLNTVASLFTAMIWRLLQSRAHSWSAAKRAQWLFTLRIFPGLAAIICVVALLVPAYITHEPRHKTEAVTAKLAALAAISAVGLLLAAWRGLAAWLATRKLVKNWLGNSEMINTDQTNLLTAIPAYRLRHQFPVIAVVGAFRPRLFIADHLFDSLTPEEMNAAIAHECGHLAARDNLKRTLLRICRDVLTIVPCGRLLDREWAEASEAAADEFAARNGSQPALNLAAALVKIARMVPAGLSSSLSTKTVGALLIGENMVGITGRVERLIRLASATDSDRIAATAIPNSLWLAFGVLFATVIIATNSSLLSIHQLIEVIVSTLQ